MINFNATDKKTGALMAMDASATGPCWINLVNPSDSEVNLVSEITGISDAMLKVALDEEESAHIDIEGKSTLVVVDIPILEESGSSVLYSTQPLGIIFTDKHFVTVCTKESSLISDFLSERVKGFVTQKHDRFLLRLLYRNTAKFLQNLRQIEKASHRIQTELQKSMKNKEVFLLLELEKSLVYYSTSLRANEAVIDKVAKFDAVRADVFDLALLDDLVIENRQAIEMCNIYRDILSGTMDAYASIINNNVNIVMKLLTVITIILSIPTLIASLWGMNVRVPFADNAGGFWILTAIIVVLTTATAYIIIKRSGRMK